MLLLLAVMAAAIASLFFSTLTYSLREFSRPRLADLLEASGRGRWLDSLVESREDLIFLTAVLRLCANIVLLLCVLAWLQGLGVSPWVQYGLAFGLAIVLSLVCSVAVPLALAAHAAEQIVAYFTRFLHVLNVLLYPVTRIMHAIDELVRRAAGKSPAPEPEEIEQDILSVVEEGEKEGVVDEQEREMIESVIEFRDTHVGQIMTARPEIVAIEAASTLDQVKRTLEESGHSRLPVYDGTLDHIVGILYARDLLKHLGRPPEEFDIRATIRPAVFVPETKPLRDLLHEFRLQKVHLAIVLDEYGGTAGLVTIEDILEELVGEISDEHEPAEPPMLRRIDENTYEADARLAIDEANRVAGLGLPEDAGYETLGGFVLASLGRVPPKGTSFEHGPARLTITDAEPQRVKRLRIELLPQPATPAPKAEA